MINEPEPRERMQAVTVEAVLVDELQQLLERQLDLARAGSLAGLQQLGERVDAVVSRITEAGMMDSPPLRSRMPALEGLYRELCTVLVAQQQETSNTLRAVRQGKRLLRTYEKHVSRK
jgi:hypothetical protein